MCSDPRRRAAALALAVVLGSLGSLLGCGKQGNPLPPLRAVPAPTRDLKARQQGTRVLLDFTYPTTTPAGMALEGISRIEVYELEQPAPREGAAPPALDPRAFAGRAALRQTLEAGDVGAATFGDRVILALPLPPLVPDNTAEAAARTRYYAVRTTGRSGDRSELSNVAVLVTKAPPAPPQQVAAEGRAEGVAVEWTAVTGAAGYNVYRRSSQERAYGPPIHAAEAQETTFVDTGARYGNSYIYTVTAVGQRDPLVESAIGSEHEVRYTDRFPPPPPAGLVALAETGRVRLVWRSSAAEDLAGYVVYRRGQDGEFRRITEQPVQTTEHIDSAVSSGQTWTYRVTAVDQTGNESAPGEEATALLR